MRKYFEKLNDSRQTWKIRYNLCGVVVIVIVAVVTGTEHWNEIEMYCKTKEDMLKTKFNLKLENDVTK